MGPPLQKIAVRLQLGITGTVAGITSAFDPAPEPSLLRGEVLLDSSRFPLVQNQDFPGQESGYP